MEISWRNTTDNEFTTAKYTLGHAEVSVYLGSKIKKTNKMAAEIKWCIQKANHCYYGYKMLMTSKFY